VRGLRLAIAGLLAFVSLALPQGAAAENVEDTQAFKRCTLALTQFTTDQRIAACSEVLTLKNLPDFDRITLLRARAHLYESNGDFVRAIADYSRIIELEPRNADWYRQRSAAYVLAGDLSRALADCEKRIEISPNDPNAFLARAEILDRLGQHDRAIEDATRAIALERGPTRAYMYHRRAAFHRHKRDFARAIADSNTALALVPRDHEFLNDRGLAHKESGDLDRALADYNAALAIEPRYTPALANRAIVHLLRERADLALADMDRALALEPGNPALYRNRALVHLYAENYDQAEADARQALALLPGIPYAESILNQARTAKAAIAARKLAPPTNARIALVIGNSKYRYTPPLPNPVHDAEDVAREFTKIGYKVYGYPKTDFTRAEMTAAMSAFFEAAKGAASAIVWYSGHGQEFVEVDGDFGRNYVIPVDAKITSSSGIRTQGIALSELMISTMPAKGLRMVIVDACRSNDFDPALAIRGFAREGRLGMFVVYSTKPGTYAADGNGRNSPFAAAFVAELQADPKDELRALLARVTRRTSADTQHQQVPDVVDRYEPIERPVLSR
jgi:tetratricopeptide (TPR) repeat protein